MIVSLFICTFAPAKVVLRWPKAINMLKKSGLRLMRLLINHPKGIRLHLFLSVLVVCAKQDGT